MVLLKTTMTWGDILTSSLLGILIVFVALALLVLAFNLTGSLSVRRTKRRIVKNPDIPNDAKLPTDIPASEIAAIAMALHLFLEDVHDKESNVLTIKRIERRYSPWNSKIYGINNLNR